MALLGAGLGLAQNSQPESQGQAASTSTATRKGKQYKDQQEYTLYKSVSEEQDLHKKLALLKTWEEKYPNSDFKEDRLRILLDTYQKLGQAANMVQTAKEILAIEPKDITSLYWITFLTPSLANTSEDALATGTKAANGLLAAEKPPTTKEADWTVAKAKFDAVAYKTLGWVAMVQKNNAQAQTEFKKSLQSDPKSGEVAYWLGQVMLARSIAEKKPEMQSEALFYFARAAAYDGQGALPPAGRKQVNDYLTKAYTQIHGDTSGLADMLALAKANDAPPANFKIKTAAEVAAEKEEELKKTNPELALWLNIKGQLLAPNGQQYFDGSMKGAAIPKLKGWLISAKPDVRSKELLLSMEGKDKPADLTLKLVGEDGRTPLALVGKPELGDELEFDGGVGDSFTQDPFMVTLDIQKSKITGLKEEKPVVHHRPVHRRK